MIPYILKTLQKEKYVFIERLGAFKTQLKHAVVEKNVIHPPYNEVVFSQNDSEENNFALADQISREKKCLFTEANEQIMKWVDELLTALQHNKSVTYEGFGTFMLDKKGNISFESSVIPQLNSQFEGMEPIDIGRVAAAATESVSEIETEDVESEDDETMKVEEPAKVVEIVEEPEPEPVVEPESVAVPEDDEPMKVEEIVEEPEPEPVAEPEADEAMRDDEKDDEEDDDEEDGDGDEDDEEDDDEEDDDEEDDDEKKHHKLAWLWILLLLLVALGALGFVFRDKITSCYHQWKDKKQPVGQEITPEVTDEDNQTATFEDESVVDEVEAVEEVTSEVVEEPAPKPVAAAPVKSTSDGKYDYIQFEQGRFYVIVGSFPTESDVVKHIRNKRLGQYSPVIVKQDGVKNLRVCIGVFNTEAEAEQFGKSTNQNYWVLK